MYGDEVDPGVDACIVFLYCTRVERIQYTLASIQKSVIFEDDLFLVFSLMAVTITDAPFETKKHVNWDEFLHEFLQYIEDQDDIQKVAEAKKSHDAGVSLSDYLSNK